MNRVAASMALAATAFGLLIVILFAAIFTAVNLLVDLSYALLNPRLRHG